MAQGDEKSGAKLRSFNFYVFFPLQSLDIIHHVVIKTWNYYRFIDICVVQPGGYKFCVASR